MLFKKKLDLEAAAAAAEREKDPDPVQVTLRRVSERAAPVLSGLIWSVLGSHCVHRRADDAAFREAPCDTGL